MCNDEAAGIVHEEFSLAGFHQRGGRSKWCSSGSPAGERQDGQARLPRNLDRDIPSVNLPDERPVRIIAALSTVTPDRRTPSRAGCLGCASEPGKRAASASRRPTLAVVVLRGTVQLNDSQILRDAQMAVLDRPARLQRRGQ